MYLGCVLCTGILSSPFSWSLSRLLPACFSGLVNLLNRKRPVTSFPGGSLCLSPFVCVPWVCLFGLLTPTLGGPYSPSFLQDVSREVMFGDHMTEKVLVGIKFLLQNFEGSIVLQLPFLLVWSPRFPGLYMGPVCHVQGAGPPPSPGSELSWWRASLLVHFISALGSPGLHCGSFSWNYWLLISHVLGPLFQTSDFCFLEIGPPEYLC